MATFYLYLVNIFITGMLAMAVYFLTPVLLRKIISDTDGNTLPPGPPVRYAFLQKHPKLTLDY